MMCLLRSTADAVARIIIKAPCRWASGGYRTMPHAPFAEDEKYGVFSLYLFRPQ